MMLEFDMSDLGMMHYFLALKWCNLLLVFLLLKEGMLEKSLTGLE